MLSIYLQDPVTWGEADAMPMGPEGAGRTLWESLLMCSHAASERQEATLQERSQA